MDRCYSDSSGIMCYNEPACKEEKDGWISVTTMKCGKCLAKDDSYRDTLTERCVSKCARNYYAYKPNSGEEDEEGVCKLLQQCIADQNYIDEKNHRCFQTDAECSLWDPLHFSFAQEDVESNITTFHCVTKSNCPTQYFQNNTKVCN